MSILYKFDRDKFRNDMIDTLERIGFDEFIESGNTTEKVVLRAIGWRRGTISTETTVKFCNVMNRSPLAYFKPVYKWKEE